MATARQQSRGDWTVGNSTPELTLGCLQRIADATEKMAASYDAMRVDRDGWKRWYEQERENVKAAENKIRSLRGVITRMKKQQEAAK